MSFALVVSIVALTLLSAPGSSAERVDLHQASTTAGHAVGLADVNAVNPSPRMGRLRAVGQPLELARARSAPRLLPVHEARAADGVPHSSPRSWDLSAAAGRAPPTHS